MAEVGGEHAGLQAERAVVDLGEHAVEIVIAPPLLAMVWKHSFHAFDAAKFDMPAHLDHVLDLLLNGLQVAPSA